MKRDAHDEPLRRFYVSDLPLDRDDLDRWQHRIRRSLRFDPDELREYVETCIVERTRLSKYEHALVRAGQALVSEADLFLAENAEVTPAALDRIRGVLAKRRTL